LPQIAHRCKLCSILEDFPRWEELLALSSLREGLARTDGDAPQSRLARGHRSRNLAVAIPLDRVTAKSEIQHQSGSGCHGLHPGPSVPGHFPHRRPAPGNRGCGRSLGQTQCLPNCCQRLPRAIRHGWFRNAINGGDDLKAHCGSQLDIFGIYFYL